MLIWLRRTGAAGFVAVVATILLPIRHEGAAQTVNTSPPARSYGQIPQEVPLDFSLKKENIEKLEQSIKDLESALTASKEGINLRLEYLGILKSLAAKAKAVQDKGLDLRREMEKLSSPPQPDQRLRIVSGTYGDLRHGHVCDATGYLEQQCKFSASSGTVSDHHCVITSATASAVCGYDPSPQGKKKFEIKYKCGAAGVTEALTLPDGATIRLICKVPDRVSAASGGGGGAGTPNPGGAKPPDPGGAKPPDPGGAKPPEKQQRSDKARAGKVSG